MWHWAQEEEQQVQPGPHPPLGPSSLEVSAEAEHRDLLKDKTKKHILHDMHGVVGDSIRGQL